LSFAATLTLAWVGPRDPAKGQRKSGLIRQVTFEKRFNSDEIFYERRRKR
jgi:hypothetical protein